MKRSIKAAVIGFAVSLAVFFASGLEPFKTWELKTYDLRMQVMRDGWKKPSNVVLFYVDEPSLRHMDQQGISWPWPRELYASALDFCRKGGARAVVFDLFFSEDSVYGVEDDAAFAEGVRNGPPAYFVLFLSGAEAEKDLRQDAIIKKSSVPFDLENAKWLTSGNSLSSLPIQPLVDAAAGFGNAEAAPDPDGIYRRVGLVKVLRESTDVVIPAQAGIPLPSLDPRLRGDDIKNVIPFISLKIASDVKQARKIGFADEKTFSIDGLKIPLDDNRAMLVNYYGPVGAFPTYSLAEVMVSDAEIIAGKAPSIDPSIVKDKIVIIGVAAPGLYDMKSSPFSRTYPGTEVMATTVENLLAGDFLSLSGKTASMSVTVAAGVVAAVGLVWLSSIWGIIGWIILLSAILIGSEFYVFKQGYWLPLVAPFAALAVSAFGTIVFNFLTEGRKKREIRRAFGQYLSPHIVREIAEDPGNLKLGGEETEITIFFSDIADFTTISESMPPEELVARLNEYFGAATKVVHEHGGTLDKYIGDSIMAFWGAPLKTADHAVQAVSAALSIQKVLKETSKFVTRIGIHTNPATVGNIGSDIRFNYTAIGDSVNLASRLEGLNKKFGTNIIISEATFKKASETIESRRIGRVRVKGRQEPIGVYEPICINGDSGRFRPEELKKFEEALRLFESASFKDAAEIFGKLSTDKVSAYYHKLCKEFTQNPPPNFDGVINFDTK